MINFQQMIGGNIVAIIPIFNSTNEQGRMKQYKLHGVESGGLWLESQETTDFILKQAGVSASPKTAIFFVTFQNISLVMASLDSPALSEKAFGL